MASGISHMPARATQLEELYLPQVEQFGMKLSERKGVRFGSVRSDTFDADVCIYHVGDACALVSHRIFVKKDMPFWEHGVPSLCVSSLSADSLALCPLVQTASPAAMGNLAVMNNVEVERDSWLFAGTNQHATSATFLPAFFERMDATEKRTARSLLDEPGEICTDDIALAMRAAVTSLSPFFGGRLASSTTARTRMEQTANLALTWYRERQRAENAAGTRAQALLVRRAERYVKTHLDAPLTLESLAHDLLTSRTRLCAAFKQETGESVGAFMRRCRIERAQTLLRARSLTVEEVARLVGYPRTSSFTVAFERETGMSPSAWRRALISQA